MNKKAFLLLLLTSSIFCTASVLGAEKKQSERNFEITKHLDIYNSLFRELDLSYVDSIKPQKLITQSINDMLESLDPYTTYIPEEDSKDFKFMITGEYGGVGSIISQNKEKEIIISEPYEGMPAEKEGLRAGDKIVEVDGIKLKGKTVSDVSDLLKGTPGTSVKVSLERMGEKSLIVKHITRQKIQINPVSYYGVVGNKVGYILLNQFTDKSAEEVKKAIFDLKNNQHVESIVLDLRNNPGGLLDQAVSITNYFLPKGLDILATKGKVKQWDVTYKTTEDPILADMPLCVLVNNNSASASEIVSGALQDMDRGVVIGTRTFGKGLVQSNKEISYKGMLKVTTAKYYTPSGRCIQAIDYAHRGEDGELTKVPDSLMHEFKTKGGRTVKDGGGIMPDIEVKNEQNMNISYYLYTQNMMFDFATEYANRNKKVASPEEFKLTDKDFQDFKDFLKKRNFTYKLKSAEALAKVKELFDYEGYGDIAKEEYAALEKKLAVNIDRDIDLFKKDIEDLMAAEILKRYYYQKGAIRYNLLSDPELKKAVAVLGDKAQYSQLLKPKK